MLQIKHISKEYKTGELVQRALDDVSLNLRDNEFVAILGPSGSGKTTLLNIIGGLDRYDSGNLIINGVSTKEYNDRDWDTYRNHSIGFVFQSYNLIPHQNVLSNVELALTLGGLSAKERKEKAKRALEQVGLAEHIYKKPNQMSGGQMQRVALARALVNDPDILLADEPTGALDTETSIQVMNLIQQVAKDRLVVMVTHNPELADQYASRIVRLKDGKITDDSMPYTDAEIAAGQAAPVVAAVPVPLAESSGGEEATVGSIPAKEAVKQKASKGRKKQSSMSFLTSLGLSFSNLRTKKGRTILTSFAGSIGIIGIALILSLSTGVNN
ncbi:MAG: ABC transporter ATP-binding protein, partial [Lachnospiraceae bacterium]|nr:ABC transporter ATP-binding protein [Lachnospiraceae bacterium]